MIWYLASSNRDKIREYKHYLSRYDIVLQTPSHLGISFSPEENGKTLYDNALIKAKALYRIVGKPVLADDTGLFVDYLNGKPGIYSARFAGKNAGYIKNREKLLTLLKGVPFEKRKATFRTVIALILDKNKIYFFEGAVEGFILDCERGESGFGYDPVFLYPQLGRTFAEIPLVLKNRISHRARALRELANFVRNLHEKGNLL